MDTKILAGLQPQELHRELLVKYINIQKLTDARKEEKRDFDVLQEHHKFVWDEDDEPTTWEERLARKYYDKLFKEYCICDLSLYKTTKVAMRWQVESEMVMGKGQFICGNRHCEVMKNLRTWEVNFCYTEHGIRKHTLVKLRLCLRCSKKLNYKDKRREVKRLERTTTRRKSKLLKDRETSGGSQFPTNLQELMALVKSSETTAEDNVWNEQLQVEDDKPREEEFEGYLEQLLL